MTSITLDLELFVCTHLTMYCHYRILTILQKYMGPQLLSSVGMTMWPCFNPKSRN